jgi:hypothetical protein
MSGAPSADGVLERGRARDSRYAWVVLCERPDASDGERYVVWYEDEKGRRSTGYYTSLRDDAEAEFARRT